MGAANEVLDNYRKETLRVKNENIEFEFDFDFAFAAHTIHAAGVNILLGVGGQYKIIPARQ